MFARIRIWAGQGGNVLIYEVRELMRWLDGWGYDLHRSWCICMFMDARATKF